MDVVLRAGVHYMLHNHVWDLLLAKQSIDTVTRHCQFNMSSELHPAAGILLAKLSENIWVCPLGDQTWDLQSSSRAYHAISTISLVCHPVNCNLFMLCVFRVFCTFCHSLNATASEENVYEQLPEAALIIS